MTTKKEELKEEMTEDTKEMKGNKGENMVDKRALTEEEEDNIEEELDDQAYLDMKEEEIIDKLLSLDLSEDPELTVIMERLGIPVTLKGLSEKEINRIRKNCTKIIKSRGQTTKELEEEKFNATLVVAATVKPNWNDPKLLKKYNLSSGEKFVSRILLAGEISGLADKVLTVSGFDDELKEIGVEETKN